MHKYKLSISYDGTDFHGWQSQPDHRTVQDQLETAITKLLGHRPHMVGSGRTDAGVHALGQVAHFQTSLKLLPEVVLKVFRFNLPDDVVVWDCVEVPLSFHAIKDAVSKRYRYVIQDGDIRNPFTRNHCTRVRTVLDIELMRKALKAILGTHDFRCFETNWPNRTSSVRTIIDVAVERVNNLVHIEVEADGFLYNMVRAIAGTLIRIGRKFWPVSAMEEIVSSMDRNKAGPTAPATGLFLLYVKYPEKNLETFSH